mgnify:CR=1 FL=1
MKREPLSNIPSIIIIILILFVVCQFHLSASSYETMQMFVFYFGFIPADFTTRFGSEILNVLAQQNFKDVFDVDTITSKDIALYLIENPSFIPGSLLTYSFIHGGWTHLFINSTTLIAFGSLVARRLGLIRFSILYSVSAIGGALTHMALHFQDVTPVIGASAAISGVIAAAIRFMFQPGEALSGFVVDRHGTYKAPSISIVETFQDRRSLSFIFIWFGLNLAGGIIGMPLDTGSGVIAWESHIGGFITGLLIFSALDKSIDDKSA